jgi:IS5 family transposase
LLRIRIMKIDKASQTPGFFDVELRVQWLLAKGNPLSRLEAVIDWESFRPLLEAALDKPAQGPGGPRPNDPLKLFKALLVQRFYNLSDEQTEYQINDRLSFQQFIGWTLADKVVDANTLWDFREALIQAGAFETLFARFDQQLRTRGLLAQPGKLGDARFVDVPRQRNTREENATSKGAVAHRRRGPPNPPSNGKRTWTRAGRRRTRRFTTATRTT